VTLSMPPNEQKSSTGSGQVGLAGSTATISLDPSWTAKVLLLDVKSLPLVQTTVNGLLPTILTSLMSGVVTPLASSIDNALLGPIQRLLGLTVAGADVFSHGPAPTCTSPALKG
jgi:hypothetical protein